MKYAVHAIFAAVVVWLYNNSFPLDGGMQACLDAGVTLARCTDIGATW